MFTTALSWFMSFLLSVQVTLCTQPYFPPQITFSIDDDQTIMAIDELNLRAYQTGVYTGKQYSLVMKNFPYPISVSPQSKHYVQLCVSVSPSDCIYETYWKYGGNCFNSFSLHWCHNSTSFKIENYIKFDYEMIHSSNDTVTKDYWYSNVQCRVCGRDQYPCDEIYFKKNTDIPIRRIQAEGCECERQTTTYKVISMGKPDESLFDTIPKSWAYYDDRSIRRTCIVENTLIELSDLV
ncbi:unnamed protein product [Rotaria sp. Silwood1]|nr:unnamed protein product [Rotaria sp. Silwood1]